MYKALHVLYLQAPGYFQVVQRGMDFTTMRSKVQSDAYTTWQDFQVLLQLMSMTWSASALTLAIYAAVASVLAMLSTAMLQEDMDVMFGNAMAYNTPDTVYHKQARSLKTVASKMIELAKQGVTDFRYTTAQNIVYYSFNNSLLLCHLERFCCLWVLHVGEHARFMWQLENVNVEPECKSTNASHASCHHSIVQAISKQLDLQCCKTCLWLQYNDQHGSG